LSASPIIDDNKRFAGYRGVGSDITPRYRAEEESRKAVSEVNHHRRQEEIAEAQNKAKSAVLAVMSHEIRTPMNAVIGLTSSLIETRLDSEQRHLVETIHESSNSLLHLLNDILDITKLDSGKIEFESLPFSPATLIGHIVDLMEARASEKGLSIRAVIDPNLPGAIVGDHARIRQVMLNLASNAIKFTEAGRVEIAARCLGQADGKSTIVLSVQDTGIGIEPSQIDRLFDEFTQGDISINRRFGGTGLGLAICKRIVEQMGGEITVLSELGDGSTFSVTLILPTTDAARLANGNIADDDIPATDDGAPLSILLAEDNATNQLVFSKLTQSLNARITIAVNGREALDHAMQNTFDVVFMDMRMPEMDGLTATRAIRALGGPWSSIPIIALTANAFAEDVKACRDAGMDEFIAKPIRKKILLEKLADVSAARRRGAVNAALPGHPFDDSSPIPLAPGAPEGIETALQSAAPLLPRVTLPL
jgi:signal transduction histidine kinase/AmiR/NasT family two-component response regulator